MSLVVEPINRQLLAGQVERIDVLRVSDDFFTLIRISPGDFERYPHERHTLHLAEQDAAELAVVLERLKLTQSMDPPDLRWEVVFLDASGNRLHSIFLDKAYWYGKGRKGYIDGNMYSFGSSLIEWLRSEYKNR